jgi:hypothetical protein
VTLAIEAARSSHEASARAAAPSNRSAKEAKKLAVREEAPEAPVSEAAPEAPATEAVASAEPTPPEPAAKAPPPLPDPKPQKLPDGTALGRFQNRVGPSFSLARVTCQIDGQTVYAGPGGASVELFRRSLPPGNHSVSVVAEYRANSAGLFSYAEGFRFKVTSGKRFNVESAKPVQIGITAFEKGGPTTEFADRLALAVSTR